MNLIVVSAAVSSNSPEGVAHSDMVGGEPGFGEEPGGGTLPQITEVCRGPEPPLLIWNVVTLEPCVYI